jgi:phospholipase/carboxylesterase
MKKAFLLFLLALAARVCAVQIDLPPVYTVVVDSHRCLVLEPDHLPQNAPLVVLLHGAHGSATSLVYLWSELHLPPARVACPDGLFFLEGGKGFGWYHKESQSDIVQSRDYLLKLVQRLGPKRPVIFAGLSQGAVMSIITGLHCPNKVLAIVSMSGYVPNPSENLRDLKAPRSTPILMVHGQADATIPIADAHWGETNLKAQGYHPVFKTFVMGHSISQASLNSVRDFLVEVLSKN